ncbi:hypothetical protein E8E13_010673 [Curvularia kusanoi]|uniref:Uncharacterized protein n=1 Tax=Curvularia kusanoi TaxID=90978 RepID=A0A9P4THT3_CURKU|nr:hypothetical protein E8E13_010673 [Curvularia kusanoi]
MAKARITWFGALLTANHLSSLTMLACMAVNIESIILRTAPDYYRHKGQYVGSTTNTNGMDSVIEDVLCLSYVPSPQVRCLGSLKALPVYTGVRTNLCIVPSLEKIKITSSHLSKWKTIGKDINLRKVEIVDSLMDVSFNLGGILAISPNITKVVCREIIYKPELVAACQQLVGVMSVNCLGLVEFELSFESYRTPVHPLQNLDELGALKTLCIDPHLLTGKLFDGDYLLPPKLGTLLLTKIPEVSRAKIDQVIETMSNSGVGAMRDIPPMFLVKELAWVVRLSLMQGQQVLQNMHKLAVELYSKFSTEFKAYEKPTNLEATGQLSADKDGIGT